MVFAPLQIDARVAMDSQLTEAVHDVISNVIVHVLTVIGFILAPITFHESICVNRKKTTTTFSQQVIVAVRMCVNAIKAIILIQTTHSGKFHTDDRQREKNINVTFAINHFFVCF